MDQRRIKCRYCAYSVLPYYRTKSGETKSGFGRLMAHINHHHARQYECDMAKLAAFDHEPRRLPGA